MDERFESFLEQVDSLRSRSNRLFAMLSFTRSSLFALIALYLWSGFYPQAASEAIVLAVMFGFLAHGLYPRRSYKKTSVDKLLKGLEMEYSQVKRSAFFLMQQSPANALWSRPLEEQLVGYQKKHSQDLRQALKTLLLPSVVLAFAIQYSPNAMSSAIEGVRTAVAVLSRGAQLEVKEGLVNSQTSSSYKLTSSETLEIELLEQNMIEIKVKGAASETPYIRVVPVSGAAEQSFRLKSKYEKNKGENEFSLSFAVAEDSEIFVSSLSSSTPAARVNVKRLPVPEVSLELVEKIQEPWPDDKPLALSLRVKAKFPLQTVRLVILAEGQRHEELVSTIMAQDKFDFATNYPLILESYVRNDLSQVEIFAEAIDRHVPNPLLGRSPSLLIRTASAYGRYQQALNAYREIKTVLDQARQSEQESLDENLAELSSEALKLAEESPFFDGLDRHLMRGFDENLRALSQNANRQRLLQTSEDINEFLFEHESLDDRERDRDFFVSARALSRLIEQRRSERSLAVEELVARMNVFLDERLKRWTLRVEFLGETSLAQWDYVKARGFQKDLLEISSLESKDEKEAALEKLSSLVAGYRQWIEQLEEKEDAKRQQMEQERRQGIADAREQIRELQRRQAKISQALDQSNVRDPRQLDESWASTRMDQNANIDGVRSLEAQLRALSPMAGERISAARKSMQDTVESGNEKLFVRAESSADFAGRLLRQADSAARQSQREQQSRGRRRRVASDQYYGSPVAGGDVEIKREYQVNPRYREQVLEDVRRAGEVENQQLLENYLRKVVR